MIIRWLTAVCVVVFSAAAWPCRAEGWVGSWGAAPLPPSAQMGPFPATPQFQNQTIRQIVHLSAGGRRVRIRLTNEYGSKPLVVGRATLAVVDPSGAIRPGTERVLTFNGMPSATIPTAAPFVSDAVDLRVEALSDLAISLYLPENTGPCTCHATGVETAYVSDSGDHTSAPFTSEHTMQMRAFISGVEVDTSGGSVVVLGDSISDGVGSTLNANHRWPDLLAARLNARKPGSGWGVVNMGISGNRILNDGAGQSALARFDRDVLSVPGVRYVIIFEGINDVGLSYAHPSGGPMAAVFKSLAPATPVTAEMLIQGYRQLIDRAHAKGLKILGATITPYEGATYYAAEGEAVRQAVNTWIRTAHAFDGVLDFDAAMRDPAKPTQIRDGLHSGDHLHGSDAGYAAIANSIDLALLH